MPFDYLSGTETSNLIHTFVDPISKEDEYALFDQYNRTKSKKDLWTIVDTFTPIVRKAVNQLSGYRVSAEDLAAEGLVALTESAKRFDTSYGYRYATFAKKWVKGFMFVYITRNIFPVSISKERDAKQLFFKLKQYIVDNTDEDEEFKLTGPMSNVLARKYDVSIYDIERMNSLLMAPTDYLGDVIEPGSKSGTGGRPFTVEDTLSASSDTYEATQKMETFEFQTRIIRDAMNQVLDDREAAIYYAQVICHRDDDGFQTLDNLAGQFKVSKERVRQLRIEAERKMTETLQAQIEREGWGPDDLFA